MRLLDWTVRRGWVAAMSRDQSLKDPVLLAARRVVVDSDASAIERTVAFLSLNLTTDERAALVTEDAR